MEQTQMNRQCLFCKREIRGRCDKKFCDDQCRNQFNNRSRRGQDGVMRSINRILSKNKRIIDRHLGKESSRIMQREKLLQSGFDFTFYTRRSEADGQTALHIYDTICIMKNSEEVLLQKQALELD